MTRQDPGQVRAIARLRAPAVTHVGRFVLDADDVLLCVGDPLATRGPTSLEPAAQQHALAVGSDDAIVLLDGATLDILSLDLIGAPAVDTEHFIGSPNSGVALLPDEGGWAVVVGDVQDLRRLDPAPAHILRGTTTFWVALSQALARWNGERWLIVPHGLSHSADADGLSGGSFARTTTPGLATSSPLKRFSRS